MSKVDTTTKTLLQQANQTMESLQLLLTKTQADRLLDLLDCGAQYNETYTAGQQARVNDAKKDRELQAYVKQSFQHQGFTQE